MKSIYWTISVLTWKPRLDFIFLLDALNRSFYTELVNPN
jgi:hypothetical protein